MSGINVISDTTGQRIASQLEALVSKTLGASVMTEAVNGGTRVTITAGEETVSFVVTNGINGVDGNDGKDGVDGSDGMDKESAEEFYSKYVEENSQVMGTLTIIADGISKKYNGTSDVSIIVDSGEKLVANETVLESGTIPSGTVAWTNTETGLKVNDLRKWKRFALRVSGSDAGLSVSLRHKTYTWFTSATSNKMTMLFEWVDTDRTILDVTLMKDANLSEDVIHNNTNLLVYAYTDKPIYKSLMLHSPLKNGTYDGEDIIMIVTSVALTGDVQYEFRGILK